MNDHDQDRDVRPLREQGDLHDRDMLEAAEELVHLGSFVWDADRAAASWSEGLRGILGVQPSSVPNLDAALEFVHPDDRQRVRRLAQLALRGNDIQATGFRVMREDGSATHVVGKLQAALSPSGELQKVSGALMDVTERKELENQLLQSQKMEAIGTLAGGVAHDFNNFLQVIAGHADLMRLVPDQNERIRRSIDGISAAIERCTQLTQRLLAFGRKQDSIPTLNDVRTLVRSTTGMLTRLIGDDIELLYSADPDPCTIRIDPVQFEQVVVNLAVNARDAMPEGGTLEIRVERIALDAEGARPFGLPPGFYCRLEVSDTGQGMSEETSARAFEPFFTTKPVGSGTGLGLSTVHGIVHQAGGTVRLESAPGKGTCFTILFPADGSAQMLAVSTTSPTSLPRGTETILLVEDGDDVRAVTQQQLERAGYRVIPAADGEEAVERARAHDGEVHLLLTDVMMPRKNGPDTAAELIQERPDLRVVFMSGYTERMVLRRAALSHDRVSLQKPFSMRELLQCVRDCLDSPSAS